MMDSEWIARMLASHMRRHGMTATALAELPGIDKTTLSKIVNKRALPNYETLRALHRGTGIPYDAFFREGKWSVWR